MVDLICAGAKCTRRIGQVVGTPQTPMLRLWHLRTRGITTLAAEEPVEAEVNVIAMVDTSRHAMPGGYRIRVKTGCFLHGDSAFTAYDVWQAIKRHASGRGYSPVRLVGGVVDAEDASFDVDWVPLADENVRYDAESWSDPKNASRALRGVLRNLRRRREQQPTGTQSPADRRRSSSV